MSTVDLTAEQKAKIEQMTTTDEVLEFTKDEGIDLPDEVLEQMYGGGDIFALILSCFFSGDKKSLDEHLSNYKR